MSRFSVWGRIRRIPDGRYRVHVRAIPLADGSPFFSSDELSDVVNDFAKATARRDELVSTVKRRIEGRGDEVVTIDTTFEV